VAGASDNITNLAEAGRKPAFAARLASSNDEERKIILARVHPDYAKHKQTTWDVQVDAFEGRGGFIDGGYLWPYPRESQDDFTRRKAMARYHNHIEALVDLYVRYMFTAGVRRSSDDKAFNEWQQDVDGAGTTYNDLLKSYAAMALVNGHAGLLVDKTKEEPKGPTQADEQARVVARIFAAGGIADWRFIGSDLVAVKLVESAPKADMLERDEPDVYRQHILVWDKEGWARFDTDGNLLDADVPSLGLVPLVVLRPKQSQVSQMLGRALVSNARIIEALYNRASEEDEVLRAQAFSLLTVSVDKDGDVDAVRNSLGGTVGAAKAIVVKGTIDYKTPDQTVPGTIRENISYLVQEVYRAAHVRQRHEGLQVESGDSIRLQYTELNEMLQGFSKSLEQAEREIARAWFAWMYPTPEAAQAAYESAHVEAEYPTEFFLDDLATDLEAWAQALTMNLGPTMAKRIKKRAVRRIDTQIPPDELEKIDDEIDSQDDETLNPPPVMPGGDDGGEEDLSDDEPPSDAPKVTVTVEKSRKKAKPAAKPPVEDDDEG
jgi:hypothetical protein